jgi:hypothetical protein
MKKEIKRLYITIGKRFFEVDAKLDIQQLQNGFVFSDKFFKDIDELTPTLKEAIEEYFK